MQSRAKARLAYSDPLWPVLRERVLDKSDGLCTECGRLATCVHHVNPIAAGGPKFDIENLTALCRRCHSVAHSPTSDLADRDRRSWLDRLEIVVAINTERN